MFTRQLEIQNLNFFHYIAYRVFFPYRWAFFLLQMGVFSIQMGVFFNTDGRFFNTDGRFFQSIQMGVFFQHRWVFFHYGWSSYFFSISNIRLTLTISEMIRIFSFFYLKQILIVVDNFNVVNYKLNIFGQSFSTGIHKPEFCCFHRNT